MLTIHYNNSNSIIQQVSTGMGQIRFAEIDKVKVWMIQQSQPGESQERLANFQHSGWYLSQSSRMICSPKPNYPRHLVQKQNYSFSTVFTSISPCLWGSSLETLVLVDGRGRVESLCSVQRCYFTLSNAFQTCQQSLISPLPSPEVIVILSSSIILMYIPVLLGQSYSNSTTPLATRNTLSRSPLSILFISSSNPQTEEMSLSLFYFSFVGIYFTIIDWDALIPTPAFEVLIRALVISLLSQSPDVLFISPPVPANFLILNFSFEYPLLSQFFEMTGGCL